MSLLCVLDNILCSKNENMKENIFTRSRLNEKLKDQINFYITFYVYCISFSVNVFGQLLKSLWVDVSVHTQL